MASGAAIFLLASALAQTAAPAVRNASTPAHGVAVQATASVTILAATTIALSSGTVKGAVAPQRTQDPSGKTWIEFS